MGYRDHLITTMDQLETLYGEKLPTSIIKEIDHISEGYRRLIEAAPFIAIATAGPEGLDCSPKGDAAGFVRILDERTLAIPDRPGNNRIDGFRNIVRDPRIALLFLIPGVGETLRVNGRAAISVDPELGYAYLPVETPTNDYYGGHRLGSNLGQRKWRKRHRVRECRFRVRRALPLR
jgi:PPOX class probable FMN-dependent enzyme